MGSKPFFMIFFVAVVGYAGYIFVAGAPLDRLNRTCAPFTLWPGALIVGAVKLIEPDQIGRWNSTFQRGNNNCRRWLWNVFYAEEYESMKNGATSKE